MIKKYKLIVSFLFILSCFTFFPKTSFCSQNIYFNDDFLEILNKQYNADFNYLSTNVEKALITYNYDSYIICYNKSDNSFFHYLDVRVYLFDSDSIKLYYLPNSDWKWFFEGDTTKNLNYRLSTIRIVNNNSIVSPDTILINENYREFNLNTQNSNGHFIYNAVGDGFTRNDGHYQYILTNSQILQSDLSYLPGNVSNPWFFSTSERIDSFELFNDFVNEFVSTIYIDDQNLKKRFKWQFNIPMLKEDTKYFIFLNKYNRVDYNTINADFTIYTVTTPEDYDYSEYENYLYYDKIEEGKIYFPAGCTIQKYTISATNGDLYNLELADEFIATRDTERQFSYNDHIWTSTEMYQLLWQNLGTNFENNNQLIPTNQNFNSVNLNNIFSTACLGLLAGVGISTGNPLALQAVKYLAPSAVIALGSGVLTEFKADTTNEALYYNILHIFYYGREGTGYNFDDFLCGNSNIVSYENEKYYNTEKSGSFYNLYRKTNVYNQNNKINDDEYVYQYIDGRDVSDLLPDDISKTYLTSPFYKNNEKSSSGGYIFSNPKEINNYDNRQIDYSKPDNSIHYDYQGDYIENFEQNDNSTINNYYTEIIYKTSDDYLLHNIYTAILDILETLYDIDDNLAWLLNNMPTSTERTIRYYIYPESYQIKADAEQLNEVAKMHLGIIYDPLEFIIYILTLFTKLNDSQDIILHIPNISLFDTTLIAEQSFNFTTFMTEDIPILNTLHEIYLSAIDLLIVILLIIKCQKISKEVFNK